MFSLSKFLRKSSAVVALGVTLLGAGAANAATISWQAVSGNLNGNWSDPAHWVGGVVPGAADDAVISASGTYTVTLDTDATISRLVVGSGTGSKTLLVGANTLTITNAASASLVSANGVLSVAGGTVTGAANIGVNGGTINWSAGTISGTGNISVNTGSALAVSGAATKNLSRRINLAGSLNWSGSGDISGSSAILTVQSGGALNASGDGDLTGTGTLTLAGTGAINKSGTGETSLGWSTTFGNTSNAQVTGGELSFANGGLSNTTGAFGVSNGAFLNFSGGTFTANTGTLTLGGAGTYRINGGTLTAGVNTNATNLTLSSGTQNGAGTLTVSGTMSWTGGTLSGSGITAIGGGATLNISGAGAKTLSARRLNNGGTANFAGGAIATSSSAVVNNSGTFNSATGSTQSFSGSSFTFNNSGTLEPGGASGAGAIGSLSIGGNFNNTGTVHIEATGKTVGTQCDQLSVTGAATLGSTLNLDLIGYDPVVSGYDNLTDRLYPVVYGSRTGTFTINTTGLVAPKVLDPNYAAANPAAPPASALELKANTPLPLMRRVYPNLAVPGAQVVIYGRNFTTATTVEFTGAAAPATFTLGQNAPGVTFNVDEQIVVTVPNDAQTGPITITNGDGPSTVGFTVVPRIDSFSPSGGAPGDNVVITGLNFQDPANAVTSVRINNIVAAFTVNSPTQITATVPANATSGKIRVAGQIGYTDSATRYIVRPRISGISPATGPVGTSVTINGANFGDATDVSFGGVPASFTIVAPHRIVATVPAGVALGPVSVTVTNAGGTATATQTFNVTS